MIKITDDLIRKVSKAIADNNCIQAFYVFFDEVEIANDMLTLTTQTKDGLMVYLRILKNGWVEDFVNVARNFDIDPIIDDMRTEKRGTTIDLPTVRVMLENYEDFQLWLNRIADIFITAGTVTETFTL